jgi:hypothetical protein
MIEPTEENISLLADVSILSAALILGLATETV